MIVQGEYDESGAWPCQAFLSCERLAVMKQIHSESKAIRLLSSATASRALGACPTLTFLLRRTIRDHLRRSRPEKILNVFQRIRLRFFQACGLASGCTSFASLRTTMSDRLLDTCLFSESSLTNQSSNCQCINLLD